MIKIKNKSVVPLTISLLLLIFLSLYSNILRANTGDFRDELIMEGVSVITSTDDDNYCGYYEYGSDAQPIFSYNFFAIAGYKWTRYLPIRYIYFDDILSFNDAKAENPGYYSLSSFLAWHSFFGP